MLFVSFTHVHVSVRPYVRGCCNIRLVARTHACRYAPEIAAAMLQRQQAEALIDARTLIVQGAVEIAKNAAEQLAGHGITMDAVEKARMVSNLICVICGDSHVQPTVSM
jgi:hypothetical protein